MCPGHGTDGFPTHMISPGDRAVADKAIAEGQWGICYVCLPCLESWHSRCESGEEWCAMDKRAA